MPRPTWTNVSPFPEFLEVLTTARVTESRHPERDPARGPVQVLNGRAAIGHMSNDSPPGAAAIGRDDRAASAWPPPGSLCSFNQHRAYSIMNDRFERAGCSPGEKMKKRISRRQFISSTVASSAALGAVAAQGTGSASQPAVAMTNPAAGAWVRWLDGKAGKVAQGVTWGTPWPRGKQREGRNFTLRGVDNKLLPLQS